MNINANNLKLKEKLKNYSRDKSRVQVTKISQFGLMEISRRIGQSIYETFYNKCNCCDGSGFKKTDSILIHNIISIIKSINAMEIKMILKFKLMMNFIKKF